MMVLKVADRFNLNFEIIIQLSDKMFSLVDYIYQLIYNEVFFLLCFCNLYIFYKISKRVYFFFFLEKYW